MKILRRGGALLISASLTAGLIAGCSAAREGADSSSAQPHSSSGAAPYDLALDESASYESDDDYASADSSDAEDLAAERQIIITGELYAKADDPLEAANAVLKLVADSGGFVEDRTQRGNVEDGTASVRLTVRIPADKTTQAIDDIEDATEVYEVSTNREDVTEQVADVSARISALETSVERLTTLLAEAESSEALFQAEDALTQRQAQLDSLRAVQRSLDDQVALATLSIYIDSEPVRSTPPEGFLGGLTAGWDALVAAFLSFVTALGAIVPWLIVIIPVVALLLWILRRVRRSRAQQPARQLAAEQHSPEQQSSEEQEQSS